MSDKTDVLQGTLALMILKTLETMGPQHGFGIARRIEQMSGDAIQLNHGTVYPALVRLEQQGWIKAKWGTSDNNRRAKFYSITPRGTKQVAEEADRWSRIAGVVEKFLKPAGGPS
jgi:transcriptional regulator